MIYILKRASEYNEKSPCEEAVLRPFENWQARSCTEEYFDEHYSPKLGLWRSKGLNHTTTLDGNIIRQMEDVIQWSIEINTIEELHQFVKKYGNIVIYENYGNHNADCINIYDTYIE